MTKTNIFRITGIVTAIVLGASTLGFGAYAGTKWYRNSQEQTSDQASGSISDSDPNAQDQNSTGSASTDDRAAGDSVRSGRNDGRQSGGFGQDFNNNVEISETASEVVTSNLDVTASKLTVNTSNAETIVMSDSNSQVKISEAGTYIITGTCSDGNITVKKGTTGVVLILKDLDLTSTTGATVSVNKGAEAKIVIEGTVRLTDAEDPSDENSADTETAEAFDGAAIKVKDGANVYITGTGSLIIDASSCKNGIKSGDDSGTCLVIDGPSITINAANDGINAGYDLTLLSGELTISSKDDAIHAERILTIGNENGEGPTINITTCTEGLEGTVVNIYSGDISITATDDGINAANKSGTYQSEMAYSINIYGGTINVSAPRADGLDSNGNINLFGGNITIRSASNGGEAGIDYDGTYYVSDDVVLNNESGVSGPDNFGGFPGGGDNGNFGGFPGGDMTPPDQNSDNSDGNGNGGFPGGRGRFDGNGGFGSFPGGDMTPPDRKNRDENSDFGGDMTPPGSDNSSDGEA